MHLNARQILNTPKEKIWDIKKDTYNVVYEDNIAHKENYKSIIFNRYCWELFTLYPNTPITNECTVQLFLNKEYYNSDTHIKLLNKIFNHIVTYNGLETYTEKEPLLKKVYEIVNDIYNNIVLRVSEYMTAIDAVDFVEVVKDPVIKTIHSNIKNTPDSVENAYKQIKNYLVNSENKSNRFIHAYKSKSINENQANQCIGPRGFVTDLDRTVFMQPILNGFISGMGNLFELIAESRTAAKALYASNKQIKDSEYASRRIQLLTMVVENIIKGDCGSNEYFEITITDENLENLKGKYYLNEETGKIDYIKAEDTHLINKRLKLRTSLGCKLPDKTKICSTCLGKTFENIKENSNLGYTATAYLFEKMSQSILSTKHLTSSVKGNQIKLDESAAKFFYVDDNYNLYFKDDVSLKNVVMKINNERLNKLIDVINLDTTNISLSKIGEIDRFTIIKTLPNDKEVEYPISIGYNDRYFIITREFLEFIKNNKVSTDSKGNFIIPLDNFDKESPVFHSPLKEVNVITYVNIISRIIETTNAKLKDNNPYVKLDKLFQVVIERFKCNLSILEIIVYGTTIYDKKNHIYYLGRNSQNKESVNRNYIFRKRSVAQLLLFQEQLDAMLRHPTVMFTNYYRQNHPMDVLFTPQYILKE